MSLRGKIRSRGVMEDPLTNSEFDEVIAAGTRVLGLVIDDAWRPAIRAHLEVNLRLGAQVLEFALADEAEPAPVFEAASNA